MNKYLWRVFNGLFGWHYIWLSIEHKHYEAVRVKSQRDGKLYGEAWIYEFSIDENRVMKLKYSHIKDYSWGPLTWNQSKTPLENDNQGA